MNETIIAIVSAILGGGLFAGIAKIMTAQSSKDNSDFDRMHTLIIEMRAQHLEFVKDRTAWVNDRAGLHQEILNAKAEVVQLKIALGEARGEIEWMGRQLDEFKKKVSEAVGKVTKNHTWFWGLPLQKATV